MRGNRSRAWLAPGPNKPMQIAILQPSFIPWLGYFDQIARTDAFVFLDDVQYTRRDWRNRNRIRTASGWMWLTVPVQTRGKFDQSLLETQIDHSTDWRAKHLQTLRHNYTRAPYFEEVFPQLENVYARELALLVDFCLEMLATINQILGLQTKIYRSSELNIEGQKADKILSLCQALNADEYLTGDLARDYLPVDEFEERNIKLTYQNYVHPEYHQLHAEFFSHLSVIDLLFNEGPRSLKILTGAHAENAEVVTAS